MNYYSRLFSFIAISSFLLLLVLNSCAALKKRQNEPQVSIEAEISEVIQSALQTPSFEKGDWPAYNWWSEFGDDQLGKFMEIAIENNPDLLASSSRVIAAEEKAQKTRSKLIPSLSGGFKDSYEHLSKNGLVRFPPSIVPPVVNQIHLALNFEYELDLFGKNRSLYRSLIGSAKASAAEMSASLLLITAKLAETYINYASNLQILELNEEIRDALKLYLELTELRLNFGLSNQIDVDRASANLLEAENQIVMYAQEVNINESQMRILMGMSPESGEEIEKPTLLFDHPFALPDNIPLNLLSRRPDLMAQIWVVESKAQMIKASKAAFFPNINLSAFGGLETLNWNTLFSTNSLAGAITPAINLPLFAGGRLTADLNENYALYDAAVHEYNSLVLTATKEVFDQITTLNAVNEESALQDEIFEKNLKCSTLILQRYENGLDDYLETLNAQIKVLQEGIKNVEVGNKRFLAALKLIKALGGGYHDRANSK